ncbi:MAG: Mur ligase family protein [Patescibacteria group bacterium]
MKQKISIVFLNYLRILAKIQLFKIRIIQIAKKRPLCIIGITGSAGKTSTLSALHSALSPQYQIKTNSGSNSESGIPLDILGLKIKEFSLTSWLKIALLSIWKILTNWQSYQIYIAEMGIDSPKEPKNMTYLLKIFTPDIGIFLNVSPVHLEYFDSLDQIALEKAKMIASLPSSGFAILNLEDPLVKKYAQNTPARIVPIKPVKINFPGFIIPDVYQDSFGAAIATARVLGIKTETATINIINNFRLPPGRASILRGLNNSTIIDSTYNASPLAATEMLNFLRNFPPPRIAVLGDMRELGQASREEHQKLYTKAIKSSDLLISVGPLTCKYFGPKAQKFDFWWQAADYMKTHLPTNATVLVKGSQNTIFLEELVKSLLQNPSDKQLLCRQNNYWQKTKSAFRKSIKKPS